MQIAGFLSHCSSCSLTDAQPDQPPPNFTLAAEALEWVPAKSRTSSGARPLMLILRRDHWRGFPQGIREKFIWVPGVEEGVEAHINSTKRDRRCWPDVSEKDWADGALLFLDAQGVDCGGLAVAASKRQRLETAALLAMIDRAVVGRTQDRPDEDWQDFKIANFSYWLPAIVTIAEQRHSKALSQVKKRRRSAASASETPRASLGAAKKPRGSVAEAIATIAEQRHLKALSEQKKRRRSAAAASETRRGSLGAAKKPRGSVGEWN